MNDKKGGGGIAQKGHQPNVRGHQPLNEGFQPGKVQGGHQPETTQSSPANPPSGGSSGKPAASPKSGT